MIGYSKPPLVQTFKTPKQIVGYSNLDTFADYIRMCEASAKTGEPPSRKDINAFGKEVITEITKVLAELRENGYYPNGIGGDGKVQYEIALKSDVQVMFDTGLAAMPRYSEAQIMAMARGQQLGRILGDVPRVSSSQLRAEELR